MELDNLPGRRPGTRGRIVMLVDNTVNGDSRVQKEARSAAAAGWDVILLGRSPNKHEQRWKLGDAEVVLLPVPTPLGKRRHEYRRAPLRSPLAYPSGRLAAYRRQYMKARRVDLNVRLAQAKLNGSALARVALLPPRVTAKIASKWVAVRWKRTRALEQRRKEMTSPLDRFTTAFWLKTMGDRAWRRLDPGLWDYELAYGKVIDALKPDLVHANDFRMLGVGARATLRARARGGRVKLVWDAHEFLPGIKPWNSHPRWHPAQCAHEREYAKYADAVVTVSETLADMLIEEHGLKQRPSVVLNAPDADLPASPDGEPVPDLRELCGIGPDVPLTVYSGAAAPQRGLDIMIESLPRLEGVHVALVVLRPTTGYVAELLVRAEELGVADRVHALPYVPHYQVVPFLSAADVGVIPIHHWPNHEIALITKFFEYSHARLPFVVSDVKTMGDMVRQTGQGEVFRAEDLDDYVRAVRAVLADRKRYRAAYDAPGLLEQWTWKAQAEILDTVYSGLVPGSAPAARAEKAAGTVGAVA
ncbi:glycosyltransferase family 4 protein [Streptomyces sp. TRM 70361]|uniref:glycosyltransferase family 4 protein n=1 Tax=Streptomyces sp. TRM 70361 TaxID=3116553 RepID=UPI002E7B5FCC|nr:glycosyltransferase family 4 protein [Streptomyces sp. TRM 70361]MEE1938134.1 glycosyltransferase family 4 protein [Streptomyces sp. TRM 70361]